MIQVPHTFQRVNGDLTGDILKLPESRRDCDVICNSGLYSGATNYYLTGLQK